MPAILSMSADRGRPELDRAGQNEAIDPKPTLALRHPGQPQTFIHALAPGKISRMVARSVGTEATYSEAGVEHKTLSRRCLGFLQKTEPRERSGEIKMRHRLIWIGLDAPAEPRNRVGVGTETRSEHADTVHPAECSDISGREAERLVDVGLRFRATTEKKLCPTDENVSVGQIPI